MFPNTTTIRPSRPATPTNPARTSRAAEDAELVRRFHAGDEAAFAEIMNHYHPRVLAIARRLLNNDLDADDIAQDTFIRAHRGLANFRGDSSLSTWLYRIATNLARNRYWYFFRRHRQDTMSLNQPISAEHPHQLPELEATDSPSPLRQTMRNEFVELVGRCLDQLDTPHRDILRMRYIQHFSYDEIGSSLHLNFGTVKSRMARARERLRKLILSSAPELGRKASMEDFFEPVCKAS
jgi:RNA polymerase sigma-70 factor (ECF subfamily)